MRKKYSMLSAVFTFILAFGIAQSSAQTPAKTLGDIHLTVQPVNIVGSESKFKASVPVNERVPLLQGESVGAELSHGDGWKLETFAVGDRKTNEGAVLTLTLNVFRWEWEEEKIIQERFNLLKNQTAEFSLKVDDIEFKISAVYE